MPRVKPSTDEIFQLDPRDAVIYEDITESDYGRSMTFYLGSRSEVVTLVSKEARKLLVEFANGGQVFVQPFKCVFN